MKQKCFKSQISSIKNVQNLVGVPSCYMMSLKRIGRLINVTVYDFRMLQILSLKTLCYRSTKRMIDYFAGTTCFFTLNSPQTVGFCVTSYLIMIQNESTHRKTQHFYVLKCD